MAATGPDHYSIMGVSPNATPDEIRRRYRERARVLHPDRSRTGSAAAMARLNEAYRILSDPQRRAEYDRKSSGFSTPSGNGTRRDQPVPTSSLEVRFPWRFVLVLAVVGIAGVLVSSALAGPDSDAEPDGVLRAGSCVDINNVGFAVEVNCIGDGNDLVVSRLVPTDAVCGDGSLGYLDRLGLGRVCLTRP